MQALIKFIYRYYPHLLFILLELICFILIVNNNHYQRVTYLNASSAVFSTIDNKTTDITGYFKLRETNNQLTLSNSELLNKLYQKQIETIIYPDTVRDTILKIEYQFFPAEIVNKTTNRQHNFLTINVGEADGVASEMGVITERGVVGIVKNVSKNFATVMPLQNISSRISGVLEKSNNLGSVSWDGINPQFVQLNDIPNYVEVNKGEKVFTSGYSSIFPPSFEIGSVYDIKDIEGQNFKSITLQPSTDLQAIKYVYVVKYLFKQEQLQLEAELQNE